METYSTSKGKLTASEIFTLLEYNCYAANRDYGMTHEQLLSIGVGNEKMKLKYESEAGILSTHKKAI